MIIAAQAAIEIHIPPLAPTFWKEQGLAEHLSSLDFLSLGKESYHQCIPLTPWVSYIWLCYSSTDIRVAEAPHEDQEL